MSESSDRGRAFEVKIQKLTRQKLDLDIRRDKQSGAGIHKQDIRDRYNELPIFIECKDHKTTKLKEWWREANAKSNYGQAPVVVFPDDEETLCIMRYSDLLQIIQESRDWRKSTDELRIGVDYGFGKDVSVVVKRKVESGAKTCRNGHLSDIWGYCQQLDCKFSRGYKPKKVKNNA